MQIHVQGLAIHYTRTGETGKPKLLVIHGWSDSSAGWAETAVWLSDSYDIVIPDLPGFGDSQMPDEAWDLNEYGRCIGEFTRTLPFKPDIVLAHSNGGAIAVRGLANNVLTADKLILLDSSGLRGDFKGRTKVVRILTKAGKYLSYPLPKAIKRRLRHGVYKMAGSDMLVKEGLQETYKRIVTDDVQASAARLSLPTLIIYGEDDEITPVAYGRILHSLIDGSTLEVIIGAGHFAHLDKPGPVTRLIGDFTK